MHPNQNMIEAGQRIASDLMDAQVSWLMNGIGGGKTWREFINQDLPNKDLIEQYIDQEICSIEAIYIAMERSNQI